MEYDRICKIVPAQRLEIFSATGPLRRLNPTTLNVVIISLKDMCTQDRLIQRQRRIYTIQSEILCARIV